MLTRATVQGSVTRTVTLVGPDEECSYEQIFVYIQPGPWKVEVAAERSLKTSGCDETPFV